MVYLIKISWKNWEEN